MKYILLLLATLASFANGLDGCYEGDVAFQGITNRMTICFLEKDEISIAMYFPNSTSSNIPTTCYENGIIKEIESGFYVQGSIGKCDNGRQSAPYKFPCKETNNLEFKCEIEDINQVVTFGKKT